MGSLGAMKSRGESKSYSKDRYGLQDVGNDNDLVPEGIEGQVPYRGPLAAGAHQLVGGLQAGMGYAGAANIADLKANGHLIPITPARLTQPPPHHPPKTPTAPTSS